MRYFLFSCIFLALALTASAQNSNSFAESVNGERLFIKHNNQMGRISSMGDGFIGLASNVRTFNSSLSLMADDYLNDDQDVQPIYDLIQTTFNKELIKNEQQLFDRIQFNRMRPGKMAFPGDFYPTRFDSLNVVKAEIGDVTSATEKYAKAFNIPINLVMDDLSKRIGIDWASRYKPQCKTDQQCEYLKDGSTCSKRKGAKTGACVPYWWGICHAWAPAAIMEYEPPCEIVHNNVKFGIMDLKGLVTVMYHKTGFNSIVIGQRCNLADPPVDKFGRFIDYKCRDLTPDTFHLTMLNIIGIQKKNFIIDKDATSQIWNQPMHSFKINTRREINELTATHWVTESNEYTKYIFNKDAKKWVYYQTDIFYVSEANSREPIALRTDLESYFVVKMPLEYILELDSDGNIIGGEWMRKSKRVHPDFLWIPLTRPDKNKSVGYINYGKVSDLLLKSVSTLCPANPYYQK